MCTHTHTRTHTCTHTHMHAHTHTHTHNTHTTHTHIILFYCYSEHPNNAIIIVVFDSCLNMEVMKLASSLYISTPLNLSTTGYGDMNAFFTLQNC